MENFTGNKNLTLETSDNKRREFLKKGLLFGTLSGVAGISLVTGCSDDGEADVSPAEDLMREHGVLNRIMLIYDACKLHLVNGDQFPLEIVQNSALIVQNFIENYHEKLEEKFLFPRFAKAGQMLELVQTLFIQHAAGRKITEQIIQFGKMKTLADAGESQKLVKLLNDFNMMYRPHAAREDTILFPAFKKIISKNEYFGLGEDFEKKEHELFGSEGFESTVEKVLTIEKQLGIDDLSKFNAQ